MIFYAVVDDALSPDGVELEVFIRREDACCAQSQ
jgi:hypothetical protein